MKMGEFMGDRFSKPKAIEGDIVIIIQPDGISRGKGVKEGSVGKLVRSSLIGCYATNPRWGESKIGFMNSEFEVLKDVKSRDES